MTWAERLHLADLCADIVISQDMPELNSAAHWYRNSESFEVGGYMHTKSIEYAEEIECGFQPGEYI